MPKKGGLGQFADLREAWQETGGGVFEWRLIPLMHTMMEDFLHFAHLRIHQMHKIQNAHVLKIE